MISPAFKRVLPSKIFEYAVMGKPIVAGVQGYSSKFLKKHIPYSLVFEPGDVDRCVETIIKSTNKTVKKNEVDHFINNFSRNTIMKSFAADLLKISKNMIIKLERLAFINSFYTLMSKFSGYARDIFLAYYIGAGIYADIFFMALKIPVAFKNLFFQKKHLTQHIFLYLIKFLPALTLKTNIFSLIN